MAAVSPGIRGCQHLGGSGTHYGQPAPAPADAALPQALHMTFGMDAVAARGRNVSVNGVVVPEGQPYLHNGERGGMLRPPLPLIPGSRVPIPVPVPVPCRAEPPAAVPAGISVTWLGDWVAVASGLGVRVASDGRQAVTVMVDAELRGSTRGLCGPYNDDPAGKRRLTGDASAIPVLGEPGQTRCRGGGAEAVCRGRVPCPPRLPQPSLCP